MAKLNTELLRLRKTDNTRTGAQVTWEQKKMESAFLAETDCSRKLKGWSKDTLTGWGKSKYRQSMLIISPLLARPGSAVSLSRMTPNQFGMCYRKALPQEKERAQQRLGVLSDTIPVILASDDDHTLAIQDRGLPEAFITSDNRLMVLRSNGLAVVDTTRFQHLQEHNRQYARLLMFTPWSDEQVFLGQARQSAEACAALYTMHEADINSVEERCNSLVRLSVQREWEHDVWRSTSSVTHVS